MPIQQYADCNVAPGGVVVTPHRYWRFLFKDANDSQYLAMSEVNYRSVPNVDSVMSGTATAKSNYDGTFNAPKAIDGNAGTAWVNVAFDIVDCWWKMDFGAGNERSVAQYTMQAFNTSLGAGQAPKGWELQWSDDNVGWTTVDTRSAQTGWTASQIRTYDL